jgi:transposase-like protein
MPRAEACRPAPPVKVKAKRASYDVDFKTHVVQTALQRPANKRIKPTCALFPGVEPCQLRKWIRNYYAAQQQEAPAAATFTAGSKRPGGTLSHAAAKSVNLASGHAPPARKLAPVARAAPSRPAPAPAARAHDDDDDGQATGADGDRELSSSQAEVDEGALSCSPSASHGFAPSYGYGAGLAGRALSMDGWGHSGSSLHEDAFLLLTAPLTGRHEQLMDPHGESAPTRLNISSHLRKYHEVAAELGPLAAIVEQPISPPPGPMPQPPQPSQLAAPPPLLPSPSHIRTEHPKPRDPELDPEQPMTMQPVRKKQRVLVGGRPCPVAGCDHVFEYGTALSEHIRTQHPHLLRLPLGTAAALSTNLSTAAAQPQRPLQPSPQPLPPSQPAQAPPAPPPPVPAPPAPPLLATHVDADTLIAGLMAGDAGATVPPTHRAAQEQVALLPA